MKKTILLIGLLFTFVLPVIVFAAEEGYASWYGGKFQGRLTANGETFDTYKLTAAHRTLPFHTIVKVTNLKNGKSVEVRINDRGPFVRGRIIDLSKAAAEEIDMTGDGVARVRLEVVQPAGEAAATEMVPAEKKPADDADSGVDLPEPDTSHLGLDDENTGNPAAAAGTTKSERKTPSENDDTSTKQAAEASHTLYKIQVAAFSIKDYAIRAKDTLVKHGFSPAFESGGSGIVRVILPNVPAKDITNTKNRLASIGFHDAFPRKQN